MPPWGALASVAAALKPPQDNARRLTGATTPKDAKSLRRELAKVEDEVDRAGAQIWGLTDAELAEIRQALKLLS